MEFERKKRNVLCMDQNANTQKFALQNADSKIWVSFGTTKIKILIKKMKGTKRDLSVEEKKVGPEKIEDAVSNIWVRSRNSDQTLI